MDVDRVPREVTEVPRDAPPRFELPPAAPPLPPPRPPWPPPRAGFDKGGRGAATEVFFALAAPPLLATEPDAFRSCDAAALTVSAPEPGTRMRGTDARVRDACAALLARGAKERGAVAAAAWRPRIFGKALSAVDGFLVPAEGLLARAVVAGMVRRFTRALRLDSLLGFERGGQAREGKAKERGPLGSGNGKRGQKKGDDTSARKGEARERRQQAAKSIFTWM